MPHPPVRSTDPTMLYRITYMRAGLQHYQTLHGPPIRDMLPWIARLEQEMGLVITVTRCGRSKFIYRKGSLSREHQRD